MRFHPEHNDAGLVSICQTVPKLPHFLCFSLLPFYGWENKMQRLNCTRIQENLVPSKITSVWIQYLKPFKSFQMLVFLKFKMADSGQNGGIFPRCLADQFLLLRGISVPNGMFLAYVVLSQYILLHPYRHPSIA
jgi:hypothetical protein